ncbi:MAG: hypothetical protein HOQ44_14025, partial [Nocardia sp.]|nr:hypothetical protein [Nocardia sp.]
MVGSPHEVMHRLFQHDPGIFARAFRALGLPFGDPEEVAVFTNDLTEIRPLERQVDTLLRITTVHDGAFLLLVEAQNKKDDDKPGAWAYYLAHLHEKYRLPVVLLVVCRDTTTAGWAREPIKIGLPQWSSIIVRPLVLGPDNVPVVTDPEVAAADIPLAVLSAVTHVEDARIGAILKTLADALHELEDEEDFHVFAELTELGLGATRAARTWSKLMSVDLSFYRSRTSQRLRAEGRAQGLAEGHVEGRVEEVVEKTLRLLEARGITVPDRSRERIRNCTDLAVLDRWFDRAITATEMN